MKTFTGTGLAMCLATLFATTLMADEPRPGVALKDRPNPSRRADDPRTGTGDHGQSLDQNFAACLILGNQNEIAAAKLAEKRSKSSAVKEFAQMLQKDHQAFITELEKVAGSKLQNRNVDASAPRAEGTNPRNPKDQPAKIRDAAKREPTAGERRIEDADDSADSGDTTRRNREAAAPQRRPGEAAGAGDHSDFWLQLRREMADECLASAQKELSGKEGREFDACFIGMQLAAHQHMIDELKVLQRHASSDFQKTLREGQETAQEHLTRAKEIMKEIDDGETRTTAK